MYKFNNDGSVTLSDVEATFNEENVGRVLIIPIGEHVPGGTRILQHVQKKNALFGLKDLEFFWERRVKDEPPSKVPSDKRVAIIAPGTLILQADGQLVVPALYVEQFEYELKMGFLPLNVLGHGIGSYEVLVFTISTGK